MVNAKSTAFFRMICPLERSLSCITAQFTQFKLTSGKKVFEIRPSIDWHKGKAVQVITNHIYGNTPHSFAVYIGDDLTDEDAFKSITGWGAGILVGSEWQSTSADYLLRDTTEVRMFIEQLNNH